jgi:HrpA-like RNA helicase
MNAQIKEKSIPLVGTQAGSVDLDKRISALVHETKELSISEKKSDKNLKPAQTKKLNVTESKSQDATLPIDAFRVEILSRIARDRVIIIHGNTGFCMFSVAYRYLM